jgi:hypothetical protein
MRQRSESGPEGSIMLIEQIKRWAEAVREQCVVEEVEL